MFSNMNRQNKRGLEIFRFIDSQKKNEESHVLESDHPFDTNLHVNQFSIDETCNFDTNFDTLSNNQLWGVIFFEYYVLNYIRILVDQNL